MPFSPTFGYFLAGVFATNSAPHVLIALTGRSNLTPLGRDSSPLVNALWASANAASAYLLMRAADRAARGGHRTDWQAPYEAGCLCWSAFGLLYALASRQKADAPKQG